MTRKRLRAPLIASGIALVAVVMLAQAQQVWVELAEGDDVTVTCPTELTVVFDDAGGATVSCAAEPADSAPEGAATESLAPAQ